MVKIIKMVEIANFVNKGNLGNEGVICNMVSPGLTKAKCSIWITRSIWPSCSTWSILNLMVIMVKIVNQQDQHYSMVIIVTTVNMVDIIFMFYMIFGQESPQGKKLYMNNF